MVTPGNWRKSSYSGSGDGNACVEIADNRTHVAIRDSKDPAYGTLTFPTGAFAPFIDALKAPHAGKGQGPVVWIISRDQPSAPGENRMRRPGGLATVRAWPTPIPR